MISLVVKVTHIKMDVWLKDIPDTLADEFVRSAPEKRAYALVAILANYGHHVSFSEPVVLTDKEMLDGQGEHPAPTDRG